MAETLADGTTAVVDLRTGRRQVLPARNGSAAVAVSFLPDGRQLVTGGMNKTVTFWDLATSTVVQTLHFADPVWWTAVSPDGTLLAVQTMPDSGDRTQVFVVRIATGATVWSQPLRHGAAGIEFSPDGREVVGLGCCWAGSGSQLAAWDVGSGRPLWSTDADGSAGTFDFVPGTHDLGLGTTGGQVRLLDARTGQAIDAPLQVATGIIAGLSFAPDGNTFAVSSNDHTASVWDRRTRKRIGNAFGPFRGTVPVALIESSGRLLMVLLTDAVEWPLDVRSWASFACQVAGRDITRSEWKDLVPSRPFRSVCPASG
jgi:WD40 repeat protein